LKGAEGEMTLAKFDRDYWPRLKWVKGPDGNPLFHADLPPPDNKRWTKRHKQKVVAAVRGGLLSLEDACRRYQMSEEEYSMWNRVMRQRKGTKRQ
jgi:hypothetical protein